MLDVLIKPGAFENYPTTGAADACEPDRAARDQVALAAAPAGEEDPAERNEAGSLAEMRRYIDAGIDGFFTDDPAIGRRAITASQV